MEKEILYRFFRGEASADEERRLMAWLDADGENRRTFDRERAMFNALQLFAPRPAARAAVSQPRPGRRPGRRLRLAAPALRLAGSTVGQQLHKGALLAGMFRSGGFGGCLTQGSVLHAGIRLLRPDDPRSVDARIS